MHLQTLQMYVAVNWWEEGIKCVGMAKPEGGGGYIQERERNEVNAIFLKIWVFLYEEYGLLSIT